MEKLNFYTVDLDYVNFLKRAEQKKRGFSRVPNMEYGNLRKPKFLCGIVLQVNNINYYVPVTSYTQQKPDNFLIKADNGQVTGSLRFNYMVPVPKELVVERTISSEPDRAYRALLAQELKYCIKNKETIQHLAERTYKRVFLGKDPGLISNSCDFQLLEQECKTYLLISEKVITKTSPHKESIQDRITIAKGIAELQNNNASSSTRAFQMQQTKDNQER